MSGLVKPRTTCRVCGSTDLTELYSLGDQYVSDFVDNDRVDARVKVPITLDLCNVCTLVQQRYTAPQDFLYTRHYWYRSGVTNTMRAALADVVRCASRKAGLQVGDVVLDIGSNDGTLLRNYPSNVIKIGVEPAKNLAEEGGKGLDIFINDFWSADGYNEAVLRLTCSQLRCKPDDVHARAKIVTACGMFYDLEDPNQFIADVAKVLHPNGVFVAQLMCLRNMIDSMDVGNLCHEHLEFYSLRSLQYLLGAHGLEVFDIELNSVNGGSYRLYCRHKGSIVGGSVDPWVDLALREERDGQLDKPLTHRLWYANLRDNRDRCVEFLRKEVAAGKRVWVYGASTKGNVILQWYGLGERVLCGECSGKGVVFTPEPDDREKCCGVCDASGYIPLIQGAADRSPEKWGRYTVGTGIPIKSEDEFRKARPDYALALPYAFRSEFLTREHLWRDLGGKFIFPLPAFEVV